MNKNYILLIVFQCFGIPLLFCWIYKALPLGSVGPWIPITGIINGLLLPYFFYKAIGGLIDKCGFKIAWAIGAIPIGVLLAVVEVNIFIGLAAMFGIKDFQLM